MDTVSNELFVYKYVVKHLDRGVDHVSELEKYEKLRLHIKQQVKDIEKSLDSVGMVEKLAKQMELIFLDQMLDKMKQLDDEY